MAYGLRLRIEYKDVNEVLTRINIYQKDYVGNADVRYPHAGIRVEWGDQGADGLPLVYGSSCTIYFDSETDYEFLYLFAADARKHLVEIEKASVLFWKGYIEPDSWSEPLIAVPYPVQCTAYDGLGFLKDTPFVDDAGDDYTGKKTLFEVLQICLNKTGLALTINTAIDWEEETQVAGTDLLKLHKTNCDNYKGLSCYEVLEVEFKEISIRQRNGVWWVISNSALTHNVIYYFSTTPEGVTDAGNFNPVASGFWFEGSPTMQVLPAVKQLTIKQDYGYLANLVQNGSFTDYDTILNQFETWTNIGVTPSQKDLNKDGDKYVYLPGKQYPDTYGNEGYGLITYGIKKSIAVKANASVCSFALKYALLGTRYAGLMFVKILLIGTATTYYLRRKPYVLKEQEFEWYNLAAKPSQGDAHISLGSHLEKSKASGHTNEYYNTFDPVTPWSFLDVVNHFENFKASVSGLPVDGNIEIHLLVPYSNRAETYGSAYTGLAVEILDSNEEKYPEAKSFKIINSPNNNFVPDDITATLGDYPVNSNADAIYTGGISRIDGTATTGWKVDGIITYYTFAELIGRLMVSAQRNPRQSYQVRLADMIPSLAMVVTDENNPGKRLVEHGISYDDRLQTIEGRYTEVLAVDFTGQSVELKDEYITPTLPNTGVGGGGGGYEKTPNATNTEQRVEVMDEKSAIVSKAGYLEDEFFESVIDGESGFNRIRPKYDAGILTDLASASVDVTFRTEYKSLPVGRNSIHIYRLVEPEAGLIIDQGVLFNSLVVTVTGFTLTIDPSEDLAGIIIEYLFKPQNKLI